MLWLRAVLWIAAGLLVTLYGIERIAHAPRGAPAREIAAPAPRVNTGSVAPWRPDRPGA
jgi:hypothetical protein